MGISHVKKRIQKGDFEQSCEHMHVTIPCYQNAEIMVEIVRRCG